MPLFTVLCQNDVQIAERIKDKFPDSHFRLRAGQWFVVEPGTSSEMAKSLGMAAE